MLSTGWKRVGRTGFHEVLLLVVIGFVVSPGVCCCDERAPPQASDPSRHFEVEDV